MCFGGGGGGLTAGQQIAIAQSQQQQQQALSDQQIQAQRDIANQQAAFNQQQYDAQQAQYKQQQDQAQAQADRQSTYDTGRAQALDDATKQIDAAFSRFSPAYFDQYRQDYMTRAIDPINYQQREAEKQLHFATARQGIASSQAAVNQQGLLDETRGRAVDEQTANAQQAAAQLQSNVASARANLANQTAAAESIGAPIAGNTIDDVNSSLQTQRNAISGITSTAGDVASSLQAVPTVSTLGNIFANVLGAGGNLLGGIQANQIMQNFNGGLAGTNPNRSSVG